MPVVMRFFVWTVSTLSNVIVTTLIAIIIYLRCIYCEICCLIKAPLKVPIQYRGGFEPLLTLRAFEPSNLVDRFLMLGQVALVGE